VQLGQQDLKELKVQLVRKEQLVIKELQEQLVHKGFKV
jgi:hypothetical protein